MKRYILFMALSAFCALVLLPVVASAQPKYAGKKVLWVDSYHQGYEWSDGIEAGIRKILNNTGVELKIHRMDTKRHGEEDFKFKAGALAKQAIDEWKPDVVIVSDDNAFNYVIMPYYKNAQLPFVFCGINWDVSIYEGAPYKNTTGMIEVSLISQLIAHLKHYTRGDRIGLLAADNETQRKEGEYYRKLFNIQMKEIYVKSFAEWKDAFTAMQEEADILIMGNNAGIMDWDDGEAKDFVKGNLKIPSGTVYNWMAPYSLIGLVKVEEEQGEWTAEAALKILGGTAPFEIPLAMNKREEIILNLGIANKLGVVFAPSVHENAEIIAQ